jgi:hypothetical protein
MPNRIPAKSAFNVAGAPRGEVHEQMKTALSSGIAADLRTETVDAAVVGNEPVTSEIAHRPPVAVAGRRHPDREDAIRATPSGSNFSVYNAWSHLKRSSTVE